MAPQTANNKALFIGLYDSKLDKELLQEEIVGYFIGKTLQECRCYYKILRPKEAIKEKLQVEISSVKGKEGNKVQISSAKHKDLISIA